MSARAARKSGSRGRCGLSTSIPAAAARAATGLAARCRPRPAGASGRVTTATTSCREASRASSESSAVSGVPAKTSLNDPALSQCPAVGGVGRDPHRRRLARPLGLADRLESELALLAVQPVDEQYAVQVVGLVLHAAAEQLGALDGHRVTVHVESLGHGTDRPL